MSEDVRPPAPHGASPEGPVGGATGAFEFLPPGLNVKEAVFDTVRRYPVPCLLGAAALGFFMGRYRGRTVALALAGVASNAVVKELNKFLDVDF